MSKATILLVSISKNDAQKHNEHVDDEQEEEEEIDINHFESFRHLLLTKYPNYHKHLKRGDIIENINMSGYRSQGVYMFDGSSVIPLQYDFDDYGSVSDKFLVFKDFPPDYWFPWNTLQVDDRYHPGQQSNAYWHGDSGEPLIDKNALTNRFVNTSDDGLMFIEITFNDITYHVFIHPADFTHDLHVSYCFSNNSKTGIIDVSTT